MRLLRDLELSRKEAFEQLIKDKEQSDLWIQEHIQRLEAKEQEREARKKGHSRRNPSQEKQTPKIPKFYGPLLFSIFRKYLVKKFSSFHN